MICSDSLKLENCSLAGLLTEFTITSISREQQWEQKTVQATIMDPCIKKNIQNENARPFKVKINVVTMHISKQTTACLIT